MIHHVKGTCAEQTFECSAAFEHVTIKSLALRGTWEKMDDTAIDALS